MASTDSRPVAIKNTAYRVVFPIYDADGDLVTGAAALDSEVSKDQGTFTDCTNEAVEIATASGLYYLDLTSTEMNADCVAVIVKTSTSGAKTTPLVFYPQENGDIKVDVQSFGGTAGTFASGIPQASLSTSAINAVADQVWDEAASGHVAVGSFGAANLIIRSATAQAGASTTITLDASASAVDDFYNNQRLVILSGTGALQGRIITDYVGSTKVATVSSWITNPDNTSVFAILPFGSIPGATAPTAAEVADAVWDEDTSGHTASGSYGQSAGGVVLQTGTAQTGTTSSCTLAAGASTTDDRYNYNELVIISGTGFGQSRQITDYVGSTRVATVAPVFSIAPDNTSVYLVLPLGVDAATVAAIADAIWDEARAGHVTAGSFGEYVTADVSRISGDAGAADNAEAFFDGTGYAGTNNTIPLVTAVTSVTGAVGSVTGAVGSVTGNVGGNVVGTVASVVGAVGSVTGAVGSVTGAVGSVTGAVGSVTGNVGGNLVGSVGSLNTQAKADVNAEVLDVMVTDTFAEPSGVPAATASLKDKIGFIQALSRNKINQTANSMVLRNDADSGTIATSTDSDDATTVVRGKFA